MLEVRPAAVEMRAAALLMSGQEGGDLEVMVRCFPSETDAADLASVLAVVEIDGVGVLEAARAQEESGQRPALEVFAYAVGPSLDVLDAVALRLDRPGDYEAQLLDAGVRVLAPLRPDRSARGDGPREVRVLVRVGQSFGLRKVEIPEEDSGPNPELDSSGRWLVAWSSERPADAPDAGLSFDPAASQPSAFRLPPEVLESGGELPEELRGVPWPALRRQLGSEMLTGLMPEGSRTALQMPEELGNRLQGVLDGYFEAVALRAEGDSHGAAYYLAQLEARAVDELGDEALQLLLGQEVRGYKNLRSKLRGVKPLLALIRLHIDVSDEHRREGRFRLATFAMGNAVRITDWYAEEADRGRKGNELRADVAAILTSLAATAQARGPLADAVGLYRRALGHRPDEPIALFGLATVLSKVGEPDEAAKLYEALVESQPGHHEARLRWAVMLQRSGGARELKEAQRQYRVLADGQAPGDPVPDWIASLSAQQLIRQALDGGNLQEASRRLDLALDRWPEHSPLLLASIRLAELQGDRVAVAERLGVFDPAAGPLAIQSGGRTRFHEAPHSGLPELRARLATMEDERRPELAAAVGKLLNRRDRRQEQSEAPDAPAAPKARGAGGSP